MAETYSPQEVSWGLPYKSNQGVGTHSVGVFPDPFLDIASLVMPESLRNVLDMVEGIWLKNGTYRMAASRIVRYFLTKVEFEDISEDQRAKITSFVHNRFKVMENLALIGDDFLSYGNSFTSIILPFRRFLVCGKCRYERPIESTQWEFKEFKFYAHCPKCKTKLQHGHIDRRSTEEDKICVKRWSPKEMRILCHPVTQDFEYYWSIPIDIQNECRKGTPFFVQHMPWEILEAIRKQQLFKFNTGVIYHMREQTLAGVNARGWGIPRLLSNFAQAWYVQVLKRYNEALALDYVVPFRVVTPQSQGKDTDPLLNLNLSDFNNRVTQMLRDHRRDPAGWNMLPFPIQYQALGGEAKMLTTPELINQAMDEMLNAIGIPAELYRGTLTMQAMPAALRLFQQTWPHLVSALNGWLDWAMEIICTALNWDKPSKIQMQPVTLADDIEVKQMMLQMASANLVSRRTAFAPWGIDSAEEQKKVFEEQRSFADLQQEFQDQMAARQSNKQQIQQMQPQQPQQGQPQAAGAPVQGQQPMNMTPQDMMSQADQEAQKLLQMPYEQRRTELTNLKKQDETLHALVKSKLESYRTQAASTGQQAVLSGQVQ